MTARSGEVKEHDVELFSDGIKLGGTLVVPPQDGPRPAVVYTHGWSGAVNDRVLPLARRLAASGYLGLALDHRGFGRSDGPRARCDPFEQVRDISNALTFLSADPRVDRDRFAVLGASFGGSIAAAAGALEPRIKVAVSLVGIGDAGRWLRSLRPYHEWYALERRVEQDAVRRATTGAGERVDFDELLPWPPAPGLAAESEHVRTMYPDGYPLENVELAARFRPEDLVARMAPRALHVIGTADDTVVGLDETLRLHARAGEPKRLDVFPTGGHGGPLGPLMEQTAAAVESFLAEQLAT